MFPGGLKLGFVSVKNIYNYGGKHFKCGLACKVCNNNFSLRNKENYLLPELQISGGIEDNSQITFLISQQKHMLLPLIRTGETVLMMGLNIRVKGVIWEIIPKLFLLPLLVWSTALPIIILTFSEALLILG